PCERKLNVDREEPGVEGVSLTTGLAARRDDVRALHHPVAGSRGGVKRVSLSDALALGSAVWDGLLGRGRSPSPFMSWAWQRALCPCPELELPASWDAYLATLRRSRRQALRYMERSLRRHHAVALTDYDEDRLEEGWRCLLSLHETRWDGGGAFQDPRSQGL